MSERAPMRAFEITIKAGADTWEGLLDDLRDLTLRHLPEHGTTCTSVSGGYSGNHTVDIRVDEAMTHDRYHAELDAYLAAERAPRPSPGEGERP